MGDRRNGEQAGAAENRRIWLLAIVAVVILVGGIGGGIMLFGQGSPVKHDAAPRNQVKKELAEEVPAAEPPSEAPKVESYATGMSGKKITASPQAAGKVSPAIVPPNVDGCDHAYGTPGLCVPWNFPAGATSYRQKCAWLKKNHNPAPLSVHGADRLQLDPDKNKVACDS